MPRLSLTDWAEYAAVRSLAALVQRLPPRAASDLGGALARRIGPRLPVSRVADRNLRAALPELDAAGRARVIRGLWENLGRTVAEFPHLRALRETAAGPGWEVAGREHMAAAAAHRGPAIYISAHYGNWELLPVIVAANGAPFAPLYRAAANSRVDRAIQTLRERAVGHAVATFPKGAAGARAAAAHVAKGGRLGVLADQKLNEGIAVPFFGRPAMTTPFPAALALRHRCPVFLGRVDRIGPFRFRLTVEPPLPLPDSGDRQADVHALTAAINRVMEGWIRARPEAWLWLHRRWPDDMVTTQAQ